MENHLGTAAFALGIQLAMCAPACADQTSPHDMTFSLWRADYRPQSGLVQAVYADGAIEEGTAKRFNEFLKANNLEPGGTVYLNSPGGNLVDGMELGAAIRAAAFNTDIAHRGSPQPPSEHEQLLQALSGATSPPPQREPGACLSACALAYLGGVYRFASANSVYGVHRFHATGQVNNALDAAQIISGEIVAYILRMGVDAGLFQLMSETGPTDIRVLLPEELGKLNVSTGSVLKEEWGLKTIPEGIYLVGTRVDQRGTSKLIFSCDRKSKILEGLVIIPTPSEQDATQIIDEHTDAGYFLDSEIVRLKSTGRSISVEKRRSEINVTWTVSRQDVTAITSVNGTGFALLNSVPGIYSGLQIGFGRQNEGRSMLRNYALECWR